MAKSGEDFHRNKQIADGYLVMEEVEGVKRYRNRTLKELLELRLTTKQMTKKAVLEHLQGVIASKSSGARQKARAEAILPYFKNFVMKASKEAPEG